MIGMCGGPTVRLAPYATFGTKALSANALEALEGRNACLLAHHGTIALGRHLAHALALAEELENLAKQYYFSLQLGAAGVLSDSEIDNVMERMNNYWVTKREPPRPN